MRKIWERLAGVIAAFVVTLAVVSAFSFVTQPPISTTVVVGPPTGSLTLEGAINPAQVINTTSVASLTLKNTANVDISGIYLRMNISASTIGVSTVTVQIAGENVNIQCGSGWCSYTSARTWLLYAKTQMLIDVSTCFHELGSYGITVWAYGSGG